MLPAAASLKDQGANNGATTAFLISTPESGVDSMAITYSLLDPVMTVARPLAAFSTAVSAGIVENLFDNKKSEAKPVATDASCPVDGCCDGVDCDPLVHRKHHRFSEKAWAGMTYAFTELWNDIALWFLTGLLLAGVITTFIPQELLTRHLGGGFSAMLLMLVVGIPLYICATASTPIAAALILNGVSPVAALVFMLTGPATNITSLTVLLKVLGKRATLIYLLSVAVAAVGFGIALDGVYGTLNISAQAIAGQASEMMPMWVKLAGAIVLSVLSIKPLCGAFRSWFFGKTSLKNREGDRKAKSFNRPVTEMANEPCECASAT